MAQEFTWSCAFTSIGYAQQELSVFSYEQQFFGNHININK